MKGLIASVLFAILLVGYLLADSLRAPSQSRDQAVIDAVKQVGEDMGNAMIAADINKLNQIFSDDWATLESSGKTITKKDMLTDFESFHDKLEWFQNGPTDVQVFGNVALAQGSVKEKRSRNGKDTSGQFLWQDLLENRAGKWVVVRSAGAKVALADSHEAQSQSQSKDPAVVATIKKLEQDLGDAMVAVDIDQVNRSYADDWASIGSGGKIFTKEGLLSDFKSGRHKLVAYALGPMDVQVLGDVAVVQSSVNEKRIQDGKDISGDFVFMDLLKKRDGKWVIVRTLGARLK